MALALYRKYRPATFAEVVGQEHVTEPLSRAIGSGRINHAYLFSGPRGCGKTSSARILARSLNCELGPTPEPCGVCPSCVSLAPGGPGNIDVTELDAASHGGVDDTRELRDRAFFAPAESRYRVFIVDEAHMITTQGFNALLKIVEEPPEHLVFVFATTEPEKVLPTIRSRTHHYPFRLIPPGTLRALLEGICAEERVTVAPAVYPLVIRAGGGSARDALSVLDQLVSGAGDGGVTYERAVALLGVSDVALIDDMVDSLAAGDRAAVFEVVDRLVEAGHDPRRFAADLLQRLRDVTLLQAVPEAVERGLVEAAQDEVARMAEQAGRVGAATLTRWGEIVHAGLVEMRGATAPRLLLELLCARMLLPAAVPTEAGLLERLERLERRNDIAADPPAPGEASAGGPEAVPGRTFARASTRGAAPALPSGAEEAAVAGSVADEVPAARRSDAGTAPAETIGAVSSSTGGRARIAERGGAGADVHAQQGSASAGEARGAEGRPPPVGDAPSGPGHAARPAEAAPAAPPPVPDGRDATAARRAEGERQDAVGAAPRRAEGERQDAVGAAPRRAEGGRQDAVGAAPPRRPEGERQDAVGAGDAAVVPAPAPDDAPPVAAPLDAAAVRRAWPEVLSHTKERKKRTAALLVSATVRAVDGDTLVLSIGTAPLARMLSEQSNLDVIAEALHAVLGVRWRVRCEHGDGAPAPRAPAPRAAAPPPAPPRRQVPPPAKRPPVPDNVEPLPPEPPDEDAPPDDDEEAMVAEAARPRAERPVVPPPPDGDGHGPEKAALDLLATQLGARAIERR